VIRRALSIALQSILIITLLISFMRMSHIIPAKAGLCGKWAKFTFQVLTQQGDPIRNVKVIFAIANETHNFFLAKTPSILMLNNTGWLVSLNNTPIEIWCPEGAIYQPATYNLSLFLIDEKGGHTFYRLLLELKGLKWIDILSLNGTSITSEMVFLIFQIRTIDGELFSGGRLDGVKVKVFERVNSEYVPIWESNVNASACTKPLALTIKEATSMRLRYWSPNKAGYLNYMLNDTLLNIQVWWHDIKIYESTCSSAKIFNLTGLDPIKLRCRGEQTISKDVDSKINQNNAVTLTEQAAVDRFLKKSVDSTAHIFIPYWIAHKAVSIRMIT